MRTCSLATCDRRHYARGLCNPHYLQQYRHGQILTATIRIASPVERFHGSYTVDEATGCWLWTGRIVNTGYGQINYDGRQQLAHRYAYELLVGPIPDGLELDHVAARGCRHRHCVNPAHLEPVTRAENMRRTRLDACRRGHPYDEINTYWRKDRPGARQCKACQRETEQQRRSAA